MAPGPTSLATLVQVAEDTRLSLARGILSHLKHALSQPLGAILLTTVQDTNTLTIAMSDSGPGVGDLTIDKLTTPFFTTRQGHLGMGLTLCRTFVEAQGGELTLNPGADGRGACFVIQLSSS